MTRQETWLKPSQPQQDTGDFDFEYFDLEGYADKSMNQIIHETVRGGFGHTRYWHPTIDGIETLLRGSTIHVHLPLMEHGATLMFDADGLPRNQWMRLCDLRGEPIPLSVLRDGDLRILGRWAQ